MATTKKASKKPTATAKKKTIKLKLTDEQRALLEKATNGVFTEATFTFTGKPIRAPRHAVTCSLKRVAGSK